MKIGRYLSGNKTGFSEQTHKLEAAQGFQALKSFDWLHGTDDQLAGRSLNEIYSEVMEQNTSFAERDQFHLDWTRMSMEMSNSTGCQIKVKILDLLAKTNSINTFEAGADFANGMEHEVVTHGPVNQGTFDKDFPGMMPHSTSQFHSKWKVVNSTYKVLSPGEIHTHKVFNAQRRRIAGSKIHEDGVMLGNIKGVTRSILVIVYGTPVNSSANQTFIGFSKAKLNIITRFQVKGFHINRSADTRKHLLTTQTAPVRNVLDMNVMDILGDVSAPTVA